MRPLRRTPNGERVWPKVYLHFAVALLLPILARFFLARRIVSHMERRGLDFSSEVMQQNQADATAVETLRSPRSPRYEYDEEVERSAAVLRHTPWGSCLQLLRAVYFWAGLRRLLAEVLLGLTLVIGIGAAFLFRPEDRRIRAAVPVLLPCAAALLLLLRWFTGTGVLYNMGLGFSSVITGMYDVFAMILHTTALSDGIELSTPIPCLMLTSILATVGWLSFWSFWSSCQLRRHRCSRPRTLNGGS